MGVKNAAALVILDDFQQSRYKKRSEKRVNAKYINVYAYMAGEACR